MTLIPRHNFFWKKRRPSENGLQFGVKMAEGNVGCFGGVGQLPEGLLLPCTQVGSRMALPLPPEIALHC
eukprot:2495902-Ditylum_brightwellii.AAC.1